MSGPVGVKFLAVQSALEKHDRPGGISSRELFALANIELQQTAGCEGMSLSRAYPDSVMRMLEKAGRVRKKGRGLSSPTSTTPCALWGLVAVDDAQAEPESSLPPLPETASAVDALEPEGVNLCNLKHDLIVLPRSDKPDLACDLCCGRCGYLLLQVESRDPKHMKERSSWHRFVLMLKSIVANWGTRACDEVLT